MPYRMRNLLLSVLIVLSSGGCAHTYPLVANGYPETATIAALDDRGLGNFGRPVPPGGCLIAFKGKPDISTLEIGVYPKPDDYHGYDKPAVLRALGDEDVSKGVFVVDASGLRYESDYECKTEVR